MIIFRGDPDFTETEQLIIKDTLMIWEQSINTVIHLDVIFEKVNKNWETDTIPTIYKAISGWKKDVAFRLCRGYYSGCVGIATGDIFITDVSEERLSFIMAHEIGHILLLSTEHSPDKESVMSDKIGTIIKQREIINIKEIWRKR